MPEVGSEGGKIIKTLWKAMEVEKLDHSVLHLLVSTILKYLAKCGSSNQVQSDDLETTKQVCCTVT